MNSTSTTNKPRRRTSLLGGVAAVATVAGLGALSLVVGDATETAASAAPTTTAAAPPPAADETPPPTVVDSAPATQMPVDPAPHIEPGDTPSSAAPTDTPTPSVAAPEAEVEFSYSDDTAFSLWRITGDDPIEAYNGVDAIAVPLRTLAPGDLVVTTGVTATDGTHTWAELERSSYDPFLFIPADRLELVTPGATADSYVDMIVRSDAPVDGRRAPGETSETLAPVADGDVVVALGSRIEVDGTIWAFVSSSEHQAMWVPASILEVIEYPGDRSLYSCWAIGSPDGDVVLFDVSGEAGPVTGVMERGDSVVVFTGVDIGLTDGDSDGRLLVNTHAIGHVDDTGPVLDQETWDLGTDATITTSNGEVFGMITCADVVETMEDLVGFVGDFRPEAPATD